jgi:hypothetical protein
MDTSKQPLRQSQARLWVLLTLALVGYEVVLYRYWRQSVPLFPSRVLQLEEDQVPIGFTGSNLFAIARRRVGMAQIPTCGPVLLYEFPGHGFREMLSSRDDVSPDMRLSQRSTYSHYEWGPLVYNYVNVSQSTPDSDARKPLYSVLDEHRLLYLAENTLYCQDAATDRLRWFRPDIESVAYIEGDLAVVRRRDPESTPRNYRTFASLLDLTNGHIIETIEPGYFQFVVDVSPDRQWILFEETNAMHMWSFKERRPVWVKRYQEAHSRVFRFTADSQQVVSAAIDELYALHPVRIRTSDGEVLSSPARPERPTAKASSAVTLPGRRHAIFHINNRPATGLPLWLEPYAQQWGLVGSQQSLPWIALLFDIEGGQLSGMLDTTNGRVFTSPDHEAFALLKSSSGRQRLEFYTLPPRSDWTWWILRSLALPLPLLALAVVLHRRELRRAGADRPTLKQV